MSKRRLLRVVMLAAMASGLLASRIAHAFCGFFVRHNWDGQVTCKDPQYDVWGGPNGNRDGGGANPTAAKGVATAPRGKVVLAKELRSPLPLLGIAGNAPPRRKHK